MQWASFYTVREDMTWEAEAMLLWDLRKIYGGKSDTFTRVKVLQTPRCGPGSLGGQLWWKRWMWQLGEEMAFPLGFLVWKLKACCNSSWGYAAEDVWSSPLARTVDHETPPHRTWYKYKTNWSWSSQLKPNRILGTIFISSRPQANTLKLVPQSYVIRTGTRKKSISVTGHIFLYSFVFSLFCKMNLYSSTNANVIFSSIYLEEKWVWVIHGLFYILGCRRTSTHQHIRTI